MLSYKFLFYYVICLLACILGSYYFGYSSGKEYVEGIRTKEKAEYLQHINALQVEYSAKELEYNEKLSKIKSDFAQAKANYDTTISQLKSSYANGLQQSEQRTMLYKYKASNSTGCSNLADISGRFDRSLTEGISLVRELRETLKLRDSQIKVLRENYISILKVVNND